MVPLDHPEINFRCVLNVYIINCILEIQTFVYFLFIHFFFFFFVYSIMTGKTHTIGTRAQVWHGTSKKTSGGLTKTDLMMNKTGRIVSKAKHFSAKKEQRLLKYGYGTQKGKFGFVKVGSKKHRKGSKKHRKGSKKMRGGMMSLSPMELGQGIDGQGISDYGSNGSIGVQLAAGMAGGKRKSRRMYGGSGMAPMSSPGSSNWSGDGIAGAGITVGDGGSTNLQMLAGMAGGKRRRYKGGNINIASKMSGGTGNRDGGSLGFNSLQIEAGNAA